MKLLAPDSIFWRRLAHFGATHMPRWFRQAVPPLFAVAFAIALPEKRRRVRDNLARVRGRKGALRDAADVQRTFNTFAFSLTESLAGVRDEGDAPHAIIYGERVLMDAADAGRGVVFATAHTAGWDAVGPLLSRERGASIVMVMTKERDDAARGIQDDARSAHGVRIVHVDPNDPLGSLPLLRHLRGGGVLALQVDRSPNGVRARNVELFGAPGRVPEGPIRLAQLSGAPLVPIFAARTGHRRYVVRAYPAIDVARAATDADIDRAAQSLADAMTSFVRAYPTQWFHFAD